MARFAKAVLAAQHPQSLPRLPSMPRPRWGEGWRLPALHKLVFHPLACVTHKQLAEWIQLSIWADCDRDLLPTLEAFCGDCTVGYQACMKANGKCANPSFTPSS